ncbi:MAG: LysE family transporter [Ahrensia sp.]|nr:LysE family transporter [Ahrensia sp.]
MFELTIALFLFLVPLAYSPGPGNLFFASLGAGAGYKAALPALFRATMWRLSSPRSSSDLAYATLAQTNGQFMLALKYTGAAYVFWLAWKLYRSGTITPDGQHRQIATIYDGALLLVLNPKAYVIIGLMFSQFYASNGCNKPDANCMDKLIFYAQ